MFNFWKEFVSYRDNMLENDSLASSLADVERKRQTDVAKQKLNYERRRLSKLVTEKRKRQHMLKEKERTKGQDLFRLVFWHFSLENLLIPCQYCAIIFKESCQISFIT